MRVHLNEYESSLFVKTQKLNEWKHNRYGLSDPKPIVFKLKRSFRIFNKNKWNFFSLLMIYFVLETIGNSFILLIQWSLFSIPENENILLVDLTASWTIRIYRSILHIMITHIINSMVKRRGNIIDFNDFTTLPKYFNFKTVFLYFFCDTFITSPVTVAHTLMSIDIALALTYLIMSLLLNWLFGMIQCIIYEDQCLPFIDCIVWSCSAALSPLSIQQTLFSSLVESFGTIFVIPVPILLLFHSLTFYEIFGYSSPDEIQYGPH